MDRYEAQYEFWSSFRLPTYEENSVPDLKEIEFPYLTYQAVSGPFDSEMVVNASIWTRATSWWMADYFADEIESRLKNGGVVQTYNGGIIWITANPSFAQSMGDPDDDRIKRKLLTVTLHFY